jgi:arginine utilization protein RocB
MSERTIHMYVYRDLRNRQVGEPDDGPLAWKAHRAREQAIREALANTAFNVKLSEEVTDNERSHELAEVVVTVVAHPTTQAIMTGAAIYVGKVIATQIDEMMGNAVAQIIEKFIERFRKKTIGDFWLTLPDGSRVAVNPNSDIKISLKNGKVISFNSDSPPSDLPDIS